MDKNTNDVNENSNNKNVDIINKNRVSRRRSSRRSNYKSRDILHKFEGIFMPLIPLLIACGIILSINNIFAIFIDDIYRTSNIFKVMSIIGNSTFSILSVLVGINTAKQCGSNMPMLGGVVGVIMSSSSLSSIKVWGMTLVPGYGGIISVILVVILAVFIEKICIELVSGPIKVIIIPIVTLIISVTVILFIIQPLCATISLLLNNLIFSMITSSNITISVIGGGLAGALFLPLSIFGMNQFLMPMNETLVSLVGYSVLFPAIVTAGMSQVGSAIAIIRRTKSKRLSNIAKLGLIPGILGVGESLIYGVTLPLMRPFLGACLGAFIGGAMMVLFNVGVTSFSISGLPLALLISNGKVVYFIIASIVSYISGYVFTSLLGFIDTVD